MRETDHAPHPACPPAFEGVRGLLSFLSTSTLVWRDSARPQIRRTSLRKTAFQTKVSKVRLHLGVSQRTRLRNV